MTENRYAKVMGVDDDTSGHPVVEAPFGYALVELGRQRDDIVGLTADLGKYTDIHPFAEAFPDRFYNVGMAEQNLIAVAAGLAKTGDVPFATTYGVFATRRAYDYIAIACAHSRANVKIVAGLPGLTTSYGGTHQAIEDLALMRLVPGLVVIDPCDATDIEQMTHAAAAHDGPVYMRLLRGKVNRVLDPATYRFEIGKATALRQGSDVVIVATGLMTEHALTAAASLARGGVSAGVLHMPTLKPFDRETLLAFVAPARAIVTAENHVTAGGLATQVAEAFYDAGMIKPIARIGIPDAFIEQASVPTLAERIGLTAEAIEKRALDVLEGTPGLP